MKLSYHVHSNFSDGTDSIKDIITYAKKLHLDEIGISDHFCLLEDGYSIKTKEDLDNYIKEVLSVSDGIVIRLGLEADFTPDTVDEVSKIISFKPFDYIIGSVHLIDGVSVDASKTPKSFFTKDIFIRYWDLIYQMAKSKKFDIVGHMDVIKKHGIYTDIDLSKNIEKALQEIKKSNMTVELNTSGWFYPCKEQYPSLNILKRCIDLDIPIIVGADAHKKEDLCREFDRAKALLQNIGYSKEVYYVKRKRYL
jgi:histidinol-phosphatase (PHP family)